MPEQRVFESPDVPAAALSGADCPGLRPRFEVSVGDQVAVGDVLFRDRANPEVAFAAPLAGRVATIELGPRRTLGTISIEVDDGAEERVEVPRSASVDDIRAALLTRGLWPAFLTRPFGRIPKPDAVPDAIFVTATEVALRGPDPHVVIGAARADFDRGIDLLARLTEGPLFVCQGRGPALAQSDGRLRQEIFPQGGLEGLASAHIDRLLPVNRGQSVWTIGYQDVIAIGALFETGRYPARRIIALAGPRMVRPRLIETNLGASLRALAHGETKSGESPARLVSGPRIGGRDSAWLGRYHRQITAVEGTTMPALGNPLDRLLPHRRVRVYRPIVPVMALDRALPADVPVVPLMRALATGDVESVERLGGLALVEEDLAALSGLCGSRADYGVLLRDALDVLAEGA